MQTHPLVLEEVVADRSRSLRAAAEDHRRAAARRSRVRAAAGGPGAVRHPAVLRAVGGALIALGRRLAGPDPSAGPRDGVLLPGCGRA